MRVWWKTGGARLPPSLSVILLLASTASAAFKNDFSGYPQGSRQCLQTASDNSGCNGDTVEEMNKCLCGNGGSFVTSSAACIGKSSSSDLNTVYTTMSDACSFSKTPLSVSQKDFMAAAGQTTTAPTPTPRPTTLTAETTVSGRVTTVTTEFTTTPTPIISTITTVSNGQTMTVTSTSYGSTQTGNPNNNGDGMSSTAKTGIIAGACVAGALIIAAVVFFWLRYRRGKQGGPREESHPMLPQYNKFGSHGPSSDFHGAHSEISSEHTGGGQKWEPDPSEAKWRPSPDPWGAAAAANTPHGQQQQQWEAGQYHSGWAAQAPQQQHAWGYSPGAPYAPQFSAQQAPAPATYELAGPDPPAPAEMPATPLHHAGTAQYQGGQYQGGQYQGGQYQAAQYQGTQYQGGQQQQGWNGGGGYNAYNSGR